MLTGILSWLGTKVLEWLLRLVEQSVREHLIDLAEAKRRGETNEANVKAYEAAKVRREKVQAALDMLNRRPKP